MPNFDLSAWENAAQERQRDELLTKHLGDDWRRMSDWEIVEALVGRLETCDGQK